MRVKGIVSFILFFGLFLCFVISPLMSDRSYAAQEIIKWKAQTFFPFSSVSYAGSFIPVIEEIKKRTDGRLIIEPYPGGALVPAKEVHKAVKRGMIQMGVSGPMYFRAEVPLARVVGLPFNFGSLWECLYFWKELGFEKMMRDEVSKHGMYFASNSAYSTELVLKKPVREIEDFKGLKIRSAGIAQKFLTSFGAAASYVPGSEVYPALASGVFDGAHWGAATGADSMGFYDVCKYHLKTPLYISGNTCWLINSKALNKLPGDIRKIVTDILDRHFYSRSMTYKFAEAVTLRRVQKEKGVKVIYLSPTAKKKMAQAGMKIWDEVAKKDAQCEKAVNMLKDFLKKIGSL